MPLPPAMLFSTRPRGCTGSRPTPSSSLPSRPSVSCPLGRPAVVEIRKVDTLPVRVCDLPLKWASIASTPTGPVTITRLSNSSPFGGHFPWTSELYRQIAATASKFSIELINVATSAWSLTTGSLPQFSQFPKFPTKVHLDPELEESPWAPLTDTGKFLSAFILLAPLQITLFGPLTLLS